jgi:hypothetical protein
MEFFESAMVPQVMLNGFLGFAPRADGFKLDPRLPAGWPELKVDQIRFQGLVLSIRTTCDSIEIRKQGAASEPLFLRLPEGGWEAVLLREDGSVLREAGQARQRRRTQTYLGRSRGSAVGEGEWCFRQTPGSLTCIKARTGDMA